MTEDEKNLDLLAVFHYVVGGFVALCFCFPFLHMAFGIAMVSGVMDGKNAPPRFLGWIFILGSALLILVGWTLAGFIIAAGRKLKRRVSRTFCLVMAGIECSFTPFGTVLGVITIVVLMKDSVKQLFSQQATASDGQSDAARATVGGK